MDFWEQAFCDEKKAYGPSNDRAKNNLKRLIARESSAFLGKEGADRGVKPKYVSL